jgi:hypothetical protein
VTSELALLLATAASIGVLHTLLGPDHYLPFVALARARGWSLMRTLGTTAVCGVGHVLGSVALGGLGVALGWALGSVAAIEALRGSMAAWLLVGFGLIYGAWGVRRALRRREHDHLHAHLDGTLHRHPHDHLGAHGHPHVEREGRRLGSWSLLAIFVLGPCEPLVPLLMVPAARADWPALGALALVFSLATIATMLAVVSVGVLGLSRLPAAATERWSHALAGTAILLCGLGMGLFGL